MFWYDMGVYAYPRNLKACGISLRWAHRRQIPAQQSIRTACRYPAAVVKHYYGKLRS
ncbi:hypothetical protein [Paenibacillus sp. 22594]|uniref:hypothetical protein n=1 Tax=Paenibacillus sp. 22594 TaxID=3453947 RepID=UPI003F864B4B